MPPPTDDPLSTLRATRTSDGVQHIGRRGLSPCYPNEDGTGWHAALDGTCQPV